MITRLVLVKLGIKNAIVTAKLNKPDVDVIFGPVEPESITVMTDENGNAELLLWPNSRGSKNSFYRVVISTAEGNIVSDMKAFVENIDGSHLSYISTPYKCGGDVIDGKQESSDFDEALQAHRQEVNPHVNLKSIIPDNGLTLRVPTDLPNLQEAVDFAFKSYCASGSDVHVLIESNYQPASGLTVSNGDYSFIQISSVDDVVTVSPSFTGSGLIGDNANLPVWNILLDLNGLGTGTAYEANNVSKGFISPGCGMKNGMGRGLHASNASKVSADNCVFTGFQQAGCHSSRTSDVQCSFADFSGNSLNPANTFGAVYASRTSRIHGADIDASNSGGDGVRAQRQAIISVPGINVSGAAKIALVAVSAARIYAENNTPIMEGLKGPALVAQFGAYIGVGAAAITFSAGMSLPAIESRNSFIYCPGVSLSGHEGIGVFGKGVGVAIAAFGSSILGGTVGALAEQDANVDLSSAEVSGASGVGVLAKRGGKVCARNAIVTGNTLDMAIEEGASIVAIGCTTTLGLGSPDLGDTNLTGGFNFNDNGNRGFIWV